DLEVERNGDEVLLDHLEVRITEEPGPGPDAGASGPSQRMAVAHPDQERFAFFRRLLPRLEQIRHPGPVVEPAGQGLDPPPQLVELLRRKAGRLLVLRAVGPQSAWRGAEEQTQSQHPDRNGQPAHEHEVLPVTPLTDDRAHSRYAFPRMQEYSRTQ